MKRMMNLFVVLGVLFGVGMLYYPSISNYVLQQNIIRGTTSYESYYDSLSKEEVEQQYKLASEYNQAVRSMHIRYNLEENQKILDKYNDILNFNGIMGYLRIPQINVYLPISHGVSEYILKSNIGHLRNTAFPIGGAGNNSILTGHTGLASALLLTDMDQLKVGDEVSVDIIRERRNYRVVKTEVIEPDETEHLGSYPGKDYLTVITCTPYGINSHRLVVWCEYVKSAEIVKDIMKGEDVSLCNPIFQYVVVVAVILMILFWGKRKQKKK